MNSLPLISHHLFVAAIGNEGRASERSMRRQRSSASADSPARPIALEVVDDARTINEGTRRLLRARLVETRA
jgi:hypothetical protein